MQENYNVEELMELADSRQFRKLKDVLMEYNEVDIAAFIEALDSEKNSGGVPDASQGAGK